MVETLSEPLDERARRQSLLLLLAVRGTRWGPNLMFNIRSLFSVVEPSTLSEMGDLINSPFHVIYNRVGQVSSQSASVSQTVVA